MALQEEDFLKSFRCFIERDRKKSTFTMRLGHPPVNGAPPKESQFLLAAKKLRRLTGKEYVITSNPDSHSKGVVGKLRSNLLKTKFVIYETQPIRTETDVPIVQQASGSHRSSNKVSPGGNAADVKAVQATFKLFPVVFDNDVMECSLLTVPSAKGAGSAVLKLVLGSELIPWDPKNTLQYGKRGMDLYVLNYASPLSAVQAFALFLSDSRVH